MSQNNIQFRIIVGSYEHSLLCLSVILPINTGKDDARQPHFQPVFHFQAHSLSIRSMDIAKRYLVTGSNDEHIRIYDLQKRKELGTLLQHQGSITKLLFSNESSTGAAKPKEKNKDRDEDKDEEVKTEGSIKTAHQYPSHKMGKWLLSGSEDGTILIWRTKDWERFGLLKGHRGPVNDLAIHPSGRIAISTGADHTVRLWNLMTAKKASSLKLKGALTRGQEASFVRFDSTGEWFVVGLRDKIMIWKTRDAKLHRLAGFTRKVIMTIDFVVIGSKEYFVAALGDGSIEFYEFDEQFCKLDSEIDGGDVKDLEEPKWRLQGHAVRVKGISFYREVVGGKNFNFMVSISSDGKIVVWDLDKMDQIAVYSTGERLNVVSTVNESVEKAETMKPIYDPTKLDLKDAVTDSEHESDGESLAHIMKGRKKKLSKKRQRKDKKKLLQVQME